MYDLRRNPLNYISILFLGENRFIGKTLSGFVKAALRNCSTKFVRGCLRENKFSRYIFRSFQK